jgi:hypothetical protein
MTQTVQWVRTISASHFLCSGYENPSLATAFGHLLALADGVIEHYRGDLFHDALWMEKHLHDAGGMFYWAPRLTGTAIGTDRDLVLRSTGTSRPIYRCNIYAIGDRGDRWYMDIDTYTAEG